MLTFADTIAVVTGAGSGMGRDLAVQLARRGAHLALCDLFEEPVAETARLCAVEAPNATVTVHVVDVSNEADQLRFADEVRTQHATEAIGWLFNNAGIGGGGSFVVDEREAWERTFSVCWHGVYLGCRAFLPLLLAAPRAHIVNTSSVNGFWASLGPDRPHTAYSAAKFAVKGFTEALITDLRNNAPHVTCSVVMPGHIGTDIVANSLKAHGGEPDAQITEMANFFRNHAPTSSAQAATIILDAAANGEWRILVGDDAERLDARVRLDPTSVYDVSFYEDRDTLLP